MNNFWAQLTERRFGSLIDSCLAHHYDVNGLKIELKAFPEFIDALSRIQRQLGAVCQRIDEVEDLLTQKLAEDAAMDLAQWKADQHDITEEYRVAKRYNNDSIFKQDLTPPPPHKDFNCEK